MDTLDTLAQHVPLKYQMLATWAVIGTKYLSELYSSVKNGGGLKRIVMAFWFGENVPKVIATDYKAELNTSAPKTDAPPTL